jgi:hypothetical protein
VPAADQSIEMTGRSESTNTATEYNNLLSVLDHGRRRCLNLHHKFSLSDSFQLEHVARGLTLEVDVIPRIIGKRDFGNIEHACSRRAELRQQWSPLPGLQIDLLHTHWLRVRRPYLE